MNAAISTIGNREKMIFKNIRKFNSGIVRFVMGIRFRSIGATMLASFAGLSLTTNVIPSSLSLMGILDSFSARWDLGGFAVYSMMAWAVGGWAVQKTGDKRMGAIILGLVGLTTGLLFSAVGISTDAQVLLTAGAGALLYGAIGGLIIGDALRDPPADPNDPFAKIGRIGDLGMFDYFRKDHQ